MQRCCCLLAQEASVAGPAIRFGHRGIIVLDESYDSFLEIIDRYERTVSRQLLAQRAEPDFDLIEPAAVFRGENEMDSMTRVTQEFAA